MIAVGIASRVGGFVAITGCLLALAAVWVSYRGRG